MKYEKWSLGYWLLKQYIIFTDWLIQKKTVITGREKIPKNKSIVFAPNHQNALSDPMAVLLNTKFQPVWLARADIFGKSKLTDSILKFLKIMPVYRLRDGKENLEKNEQTFGDSIRVLENNFALALFPEAAHSAKRQMLVHKKAVPRIVFMAEEKTGNQLDIQIIPTGIYYSHYWKFNRTLIVNFGNPIPVKNFMELYAQNQNAAIIALKTSIYEAILPLVIEIKSKKYYKQFELLRNIYGRQFLKLQQKRYSILNLFRSDQKLVHLLDEMEAGKSEELEVIIPMVNSYNGSLKGYRLRHWLIDGKKNHFTAVVLNSLLLLAGTPLFLFGFLFNAIPFFLIDQFVRKKVKDKSFWSSFFLVAGIVIFPLFYLLELSALAWLIPGFWLKIIFLVSLPFTGKLAFNWYILFRKTTGRFRILRLKWGNPEKYHRLIKEKEQLYEKLEFSFRAFLT
jgi:1-acyl-sn-glycerol-3-phosphate acyltransferase